MSCYFVLQFELHDRDEFQKYLDAVDDVLAPFAPRFLAVDDAPEVIEGEWQGARTILIEFADEAAFRRVYDSPEYQAILPYRLRAGLNNAVLVHGLQS